jgi:hypothetical protein
MQKFVISRRAAVLLLALIGIQGWMCQSRADTDSALRALQFNDYSTAMPLLLEAAGAGDAYAQVVLGQLLLNGKSGVTDPQQAARWYRKAAGQDPKASKYVAIAQANLASLYWEGRGVPKDASEATRLYQQAARNGFGDARGVLIGMYYRGDGIPKDIVQAFKWASIDLASGNTRSKPAVDAIAREMTSAQRAQALQQARHEFPNLQFPSIEAVTPGLSPRLEATKGVPSAPSAGFMKEFEALHRQPLESQLIISELKGKLTSLSPPFIFELARRTFVYDKNEAMTLFWLARLRAYYDAIRCTDETAGQGIASWDIVVEDVIRYGEQNAAAGRPSKLSALERELAFPLDTSAEWICLNGIKALSAAAAGNKLQDWLKPASQWPALRQVARDQMAKGAQK